MANYDLESFRNYFLNLVKDNINSYTAAINTEKGDSLLETIDVNQDIIRNIDDGAINKDLFIHYGFTEVDTDNNGNSLLWTPKMMFAFYFRDKTDDGAIAETKVLRYTRALTEIIGDNITKDQHLQSIKIKPLAPSIVDFSQQDGSSFKCGAIEIEGTFHG